MNAAVSDNPVGYWRLGESSGTVAQNETVNNLDGMYVNAPTLGVASIPSEYPTFWATAAWRSP